MSELGWKIWAKGNIAKKRIKNLFKDERGDTNIIAIVLILVVVVALAVAFRKYIFQFFENILAKIDPDAISDDKPTVTPPGG